VLDEAHVIKKPRTETAMTCCSLKSRHRWCLTGTPIQNTIDDAFSLVKFLEHELAPFSHVDCHVVSMSGLLRLSEELFNFLFYLTVVHGFGPQFRCVHAHCD